MIDLTINPKGLEHSLQRAREKRIVIPTFAQMRDPSLIPDRVKHQLTSVGLWDVDPVNLFRITWKNEARESGGGYGPVNYLVLPSELTGVKARIVVMIGKWFPTGAHKVGAAFACLAPRLVTGQFDPSVQKAVWPSTGNYCRGGAYDSALLGCDSIAILPEGMSRERFEWLEQIAGEIIKTPGCESNVKEIFDKCHELRAGGGNVMIFNQFDEFGNYLWHYSVTGPAMEEALLPLATGPYGTKHIKGIIAATGSGGTIASGDYLKHKYPWVKIAACEALQCPTLLCNGYGDHRIEGIGDKHVPWIHNVKNTDLIIAIDDEGPMRGIRLFNEAAGLAFLGRHGVSADLLDKLDLFGISGIANVLAAIKFAKYYELGPDDLLITIATDSMDMYKSRLAELTLAHGAFTDCEAGAAYERFFLGQNTGDMQELTWPQRKRIHNLKYYTWVEQQGKTCQEIQAQWYDESYWENLPHLVPQIDALIEEFNAKAGVGAFSG